MTYGQLPPAQRTAPQPGWSTVLQAAAPPPSGGLVHWSRQKSVQIIGAGLIGLIVGGILGGGTVAVTSGLMDRSTQNSRFDGQVPGMQNCSPDDPSCFQFPGRNNGNIPDPIAYRT
jgi:hypothetical protein